MILTGKEMITWEMDPGFLDKALYVFFRKWNNAFPTYYDVY